MYLAMTDGTTTLVLADSTAPAGTYTLASDGWTPKVTRLRTGMQTWTPYEDVEETLDLNIRASGASALYSAIDALERMIERARRWRFDHTIPSPVRLHYAPGGSTISSKTNPLQCVVLDARLDLTPRFVTAGLNSYATARINLVRRGAWLIPWVTQNAPTATFVGEATSGNQRVALSPAPTRHEVASAHFNFSFVTPAPAPPGFFVLSGYRPTVFEITSISGAPGYSVVSNSNALGGSVLQHVSPSANTWHDTSFFPIPTQEESALHPPPSYALIVVARNASATATTMLRFIVKPGQFTAETITTAPVILPPNTPPTAYLVDVISPRHPLWGVACSIRSSEANATTQWDALYLIPLVGTGTLIVRYGDGGPNIRPDLGINTDELSLRSPYFGSLPSDAIPCFDTVTWTVYHTHASALWVCPANNNWRYVYGGNVHSYYLYVKRWRTYPAPV